MILLTPHEILNDLAKVFWLPDTDKSCLVRLLADLGKIKNDLPAEIIATF